MWIVKWTVNQGERIMSSKAAALVVILALSSCGGAGPQPDDQMIDVGTHRLHIHCEGEGTPTVVIDVGIGSTSEEWIPLQKQIAEITHVCTYDRAGYGQSEPGPLPRDGGRTATELRALLREASVPGPYVLVGHSLGALNMQIYAARYPDDVAGMILLDPPPLGWLLGECYPDLRQMAEEMTNEWQAIADSRSDSSDPQERAEAAFFSTIASEHREMLGESAALAATIKAFGDIPLTVIAAGVPNPMFGDIAEEYQQYWIEQSRAVADKSTRGKFILAAESSHHLHRDASTIVQEAIVSMVQDLRTR
jgi:pimeloyl-ACP methyl ester carboxylesterase